MRDVTRNRVRGAVAIISLVVASGAVVLTMGSVARWSRRRDMLDHWPVVRAVIQSCELHRDYPFQKNGGGISFWIRCFVENEAAPSSRPIQVESASRHAGMSGVYYTVQDWRVTAVRPEPLFRTWLRSHPVGTSLMLRQDPAHADALTFVGLDSVVDVDPVPGSIAGAMLFAALALAGFWVARRLNVSGISATAFTT